MILQRGLKKIKVGEMQIILDETTKDTPIDPSRVMFGFADKRFKTPQQVKREQITKDVLRFHLVKVHMTGTASSESSSHPRGPSKGPSGSSTAWM